MAMAKAVICKIIKCMRQFLSYIFRFFICLSLVVCFIALLSLLFPAILPYSIPNISTGKHNLAVIIVGLVSVINCFLLYENLRSQKDQFEKNTFENSFFRLIETHRNVVREIYIPDLCVNRGIAVFSYAISQMNLILESLGADEYCCEDEIDRQYEDGCSYYNILSSQDPESAAEWLQHYRNLCNVNAVYSIKKDDWEECKKKTEEIEKNAFLFFYNRWKIAYEQYFRSLDLLKIYCETRATDEEKRKYKGIVYVHMSTYELKFATCYYKYVKNKEA